MRPVVVIGGFATPGSLMRPWARVARAFGCSATVSSHHAGLQCSEQWYQQVRSHVAKVAHAAGEPVTVLAYSRGGQVGRVLAVRQPELVDGLLTVGTPWRPGIGELGASTRTKIERLGRLGSVGVPGVVTLDCLVDGGCCAPFWRDLMVPVRDDLWYRAIHARDDMVVDGSQIGDPRAEVTWVNGGHRSLLFGRQARIEIGRSLASRR